MNQQPVFLQLNCGWNAEPNAPEPRIKVESADVILRFFVNPFQFPEFKEDEIGYLRFTNCERYRLGPTNDEGWYRGQCRFSKLAPRWGEFYEISGGSAFLEGPDDWQFLHPNWRGNPRHFLFYFRDNTFECVAERCIFEGRPDNALMRKAASLTAAGARTVLANNSVVGMAAAATRTRNASQSKSFFHRSLMTFCFDHQN